MAKRLNTFNQKFTSPFAANAAKKSTSDVKYFVTHDLRRYIPLAFNDFTRLTSISSSSVTPCGRTQSAPLILQYDGNWLHRSMTEGRAPFKTGRANS